MGIYKTLAGLGVLVSGLGVFGYKINQGILEDRFNSIVNSAREVPINGYEISSSPLYTEDLFNCTSLLLLSDEDNVVAQSHYPLSNEAAKNENVPNPPEYLNVMLDGLRGLGAESSELVAVIVAGTDEHADRLEELLRERNIPLVASYKDNFRQYPGNQLHIEEDRKHNDSMRKKAAVNPDNGDVVIFTGGLYRKLH